MNFPHRLLHPFVLLLQEFDNNPERAIDALLSGNTFLTAPLSLSNAIAFCFFGAIEDNIPPSLQSMDRAVKTAWMGKNSVEKTTPVSRSKTKGSLVVDSVRQWFYRDLLETDASQMSFEMSASEKRAQKERIR